MEELVISDANNCADIDYIRIDRNIMQYGIMLKKQFGGIDGQLIFDFLLYSSYTYQKDLWGFGTLIPNDFAKEMNYSKKNLNRKLLVSEQSKFETEVIFDSVLSNALYKAYKYNLEFNTKVINKTSGELISGGRAYQLIRELYMHVNLEKKGQIYYTYKLEPTLEIHMAKFFGLINHKDIPKVRQLNASFLYAFLSNLRETVIGMKKPHSDAVKMDELFYLAEIDIKEFKFAKLKLIKKLTRLQQDTTLKFSFKEDRYYENDYTKNAIIFYFDESSSMPVKKKTVSNARNDYFLQNLRQSWQQKYNKKTKKDFEIWKKDPNADLSIKAMVYAQCSKELFYQDNFLMYLEKQFMEDFKLYFSYPLPFSVFENIVKKFSSYKD